MNKKIIWGIIVVIVLILLAVCLLCGKKADVQNTKTETFNIKELGLKFQLPESLSDLTYVVVNLGNEQAVNSIVFSSKTLEAAGCSVKNGPLGYLTYSKFHGGEKIAYARYSDLYYIEPTYKCSKPVSAADIETLRNALKTLVTDYVASDDEVSNPVASVPVVTDPINAVWKTFRDADVGIEFTYPSYLGSPVVQRTSLTSCPEMKTYTPPMYAHDYWISFPNKPQIGSGKSSMEAYLGVILNSDGTPICGYSVNNKDSILTTYDIGHNTFKQPSFDSAYVSNITTSICTEAEQFYSLFKTSTKGTTLIQPTLEFIPSAYTAETDAIHSYETKPGSCGMLNFISSNHPSAIQIKNYFSDFRKLVDSIKFINN